MARYDNPWKGALRVASIYLMIGVLWIVFSDRVVQVLFVDPELQATVQTIKGTAFVLASALVILLLVYRELEGRRQSERRYRVLVDQALVGIYVIRGGRFLFASPRTADILGCSIDDLLHRVDVADVLDPGDRERVLEHLRRLEDGEVEELHFRLTALRPDGVRVRADVHGRRLEWEGGPAVMGVLLDVTERERLEDEVQRSQRLQALGRVTGAVVHDFNNFLTAIVVPMELCSRQMDPDDPGRLELAEARESAQRAVGLTRKLLAFSRGTANHTRRIDLNELVSRMEPLLTRLCGDRLRLDVDLAEGLLPVEVDSNSFEQVLVNLVVNAAEAQPEEGTVRIRTRTSPLENGATTPVLLEVQDEGVGMDETTRQRAVEPFFSTKATGSGLGLATVHGIVAQARGEIDIESEPGWGTTFRIRLPGADGPVEPLEPLEPAATERPDAPSTSRVELEGVTALVVDDDEAVRRVLVRLLSRHRMKVLDAGSAAVALELAREHADTIALVVTDLGLPDQDGIRLVTQLESLIPGVPVLYTSGQSSEEVLRRLDEDRTRRFVEKPFTVQLMMREVTAALAQRPRAPRGS